MKLESDLIKPEDDGLVYYKKGMELFSGIWIKPLIINVTIIVESEEFDDVLIRWERIEE